MTGIYQDRIEDSAVAQRLSRFLISIVRSEKARAANRDVVAASAATSKPAHAPKPGPPTTGAAPPGTGAGHSHDATAFQRIFNTCSRSWSHDYAVDIPGVIPPAS